jgi:UDP-N-acetylmuramyl pentapeptide phosphotransferase/UDP-N-acetylglucosamine-1-phosphate transferase
MAPVELLGGLAGQAAALALASAALALVLGRLAPRLGWVDGPPVGRKRHSPPAPLVGGAVILGALLLAWRASDLAEPLRRWALPLGAELRIEPFSALAAAFALGLADDLSPRGLPAWAKLLGQLACGAVLAATLELAPGAVAPPWLLPLLLLGPAVAMNAVNTFDNADGTAALLGTCALAGTAPLCAVPLLALLPFNLRSARAPARRLPRAWLGDSGSHLLGMLFFLIPWSWPALVLPLGDLARLSVLRPILGQAPWIGDRRHLAHRLEARGLPPIPVALVLALIAAPSIVLGYLGMRGQLEGGVALGALATLGLFAAAVAFTSPARSRAERSARASASPASPLFIDPAEAAS